MLAIVGVILPSTATMAAGSTSEAIVGTSRSNPLDEVLAALNARREAGEITLDQLMTEYNAAYQAAPPEVRAQHRHNIDRLTRPAPTIIMRRQ